MIAIVKSLKQWRWYQWLILVVLLLYLLYIALSYLYLPGKLKEVVQTDAVQLLGRDIRVQRIAFNPFTLSLTVEQFALADRPQKPLLAWNRLYVNFDALGSLFGWKVRFSKVELDTPQIAIERRKNDFNFSSILDRFTRDSPPQQKPKTALALQIDDIAVKTGVFTFDDISGEKSAHSSIDDISVEVKNLYLATGDKKLNPISLLASMPSGGQLSLKGDYRADPLKVDANIQADDIHLEALKDFVFNQVPLLINNGRLSLRVSVSVEMAKKLQVSITNGEVVVTDLALDDATRTPPLLRGKHLQVHGISMNLAKRRFRIERIALNNFATDQWLSADGQPRVQPLLERSRTGSAESPSVPANTLEKPWDFSVGNLSIQHARIGFTDHRNGLNAHQEVHDLNVGFSDIRFDKEAKIPLQLSAKLNDAGDLKVDGHIITAPFSLGLHYRAQALALMPFNPYVEQLSWLRLKQGSLDASGNVNMGGDDPFSLDLSTNVTDVKVLDARTGKSVLQWKALRVNQLRLSMADHKASINGITLNAPDLATEIAANKQLNLATLIKPPTNSDAGATTVTTVGTESTKRPTAAKPWQIAVGQVRLRDGTVRFSDTSVSPAFKTGLYSMDFKLDHLSSAGNRPATFMLTSKVDRHTPFNVKGTLAPLQRQPEFSFTSHLRGLEMPTLSSYTATYIGYNLKSGKLTLDLQYHSKRHRLSGKNTIIAKQLYLGDEVLSKEALNVPVALGLALLRDANGVIDLNVGVSGDLNDPGFSVTGVVLKALKNIIVKAAASPFKLLASLVGSSEDLGSIEFSAGGSVLSADSQARLQKLAKALAQRPQLAVSVHGNAAEAEDVPAMQQQRVLEQIAARRKIPATDLSSATLLDDQGNRKALASLNQALALPNEGRREDALKETDPQLLGDALTRKAYRQMLVDVANKQAVSRHDLLELADRRALAIKQYLVESAGLDNGRVLMHKTRIQDLKSRICKLGVEAE